MVRKLILSTLGWISTLVCLGQSNGELTRIYLNNSVETYPTSGESSFTSALINAFKSEGGDDKALGIAELFSFFQSSNLQADTVTYGRNEAGSEFIFSRKTEGSNYAVIFYVEDYDSFDNISGVKEDVSEVETLLTETYGFETEVVENPTRTSLLQTIRKYTGIEYSQNDHLFIYFAGRGYYDDLYQWNYILLKDSQKDDEVKYSYMPVSQLLMLADNIAVSNVMVFIDAGTQ